MSEEKKTNPIKVIDFISHEWLDALKVPHPKRIEFCIKTKDHIIVHNTRVIQNVMMEGIVIKDSFQSRLRNENVFYLSDRIEDTIEVYQNNIRQVLHLVEDIDVMEEEEADIWLQETTYEDYMGLWNNE